MTDTNIHNIRPSLALVIEDAILLGNVAEIDAVLDLVKMTMISAGIARGA